MLSALYQIGGQGLGSVVDMDRFETSELRSHYGALLTDKQNEMLELHYDEDMSLGEIAEMFSISRQAVFENVTKGKNQLLKFEEALKFAHKYEDIMAKLDNILELGSESKIAEIGAIVDQIKAILEE